MWRRYEKKIELKIKVSHRRTKNWVKYEGNDLTTLFLIKDYQYKFVKRNEAHWEDRHKILVFRS